MGDTELTGRVCRRRAAEERALVRGFVVSGAGTRRSGEANRKAVVEAGEGAVNQDTGMI